MTKQITTFTANVTGISANNVLSSTSEITARQNTSLAINNTGEVVAENRELLEAIHTTDHIINVISTSFSGGTNELSILADAITWWDESVYRADKTTDASLTGWPAKTITGLTTSNSFYIWATFVSGTKDYEATNINAALPSNLTEKCLIGIATVSGAGAVAFAVNWQGPVQTRENIFRDTQTFLGNNIFSGQLISNGPVRGFLPLNYHEVKIENLNANSVRILAGSQVRSSDNTTDIIFGSNTTCALNASGAGGLDSGTEASNTWYYLYAIYNPTNEISNLLLSTINESVSGSIALPSAYTKKRQLKTAIRNNASNNIIPFIYYNSIEKTIYRDFDTIGSAYRTVSASTPTSWSSYSQSGLIPPISKEGIFHLYHGGDVSVIDRNLYTRPTGSALPGYTVSALASAYQVHTESNLPLVVSNTQSIDFFLNNVNQSFSLSVMGFTNTEIK
jgi:hypothetical protein